MISNRGSGAHPEPLSRTRFREWAAIWAIIVVTAAASALAAHVEEIGGVARIPPRVERYVHLDSVLITLERVVAPRPDHSAQNPT